MTTLFKPLLDPTGKVGFKTVKDVEVTIFDHSTFLLDIFPGGVISDYLVESIPNYEIDIFFIASVGFTPQEGYRYKVQVKYFDGENWGNFSQDLTTAQAHRGYILWCSYEESILWQNWFHIPEYFRLIQFGEASKVIGSSFSEDVNGDGVDDIVQEVSPEVYGKDRDELFIKADCPEGVIGCDQDNTEFVIKDNGRWIIVDQNSEHFARDHQPRVTSSDEYPSSDGYTPNDGVCTP